jgi:replicative DNA helicase
MDSLPHDTEAERAVLGIALLLGRFEPIAQLTGDDFVDVPCRLIFLAMRDLHANGEPPDVVLLVGHLRDTNRYNADLGVSAWQLGELFTLSPWAGHLHYYIRRVKEMTRRRRALNQAGRLVRAATNGARRRIA